MTSQPDLQTTTIYMLPNISRSKGNHIIDLASQEIFSEKKEKMEKNICMDLLLRIAKTPTFCVDSVTVKF